jgi:hypothetical protein
MPDLSGTAKAPWTGNSGRRRSSTHPAPPSLPACCQKPFTMKAKEAMG